MNTSRFGSVRSGLIWILALWAPIVTANEPCFEDVGPEVKIALPTNVELGECDFRLLGDKTEFSPDYLAKVFGPKARSATLEGARGYVEGLQKIGANSKALSHRKIFKTPTGEEIEAYFDGKETPNSELIGRSLAPHAWIRKDVHGNLLELGTSFLALLPPQPATAMKVEQAVFCFSGKSKGRAVLENW